MLDWEGEKGIVNYYNELHFVKIEDILDDHVKLDEIIETLTISFMPSTTVELTQKFDSFISSISPSDFEKKFKSVQEELEERLKKKRN